MVSYKFSCTYLDSITHIFHQARKYITDINIHFDKIEFKWICVFESPLSLPEIRIFLSPLDRQILLNVNETSLWDGSDYYTPIIIQGSLEQN